MDGLDWPLISQRNTVFRYEIQHPNWLEGFIGTEKRHGLVAFPFDLELRHLVSKQWSLALRFGALISGKRYYDSSFLVSNRGMFQGSVGASIAYRIAFLKDNP